jgi:putative glutamine amidotransferase
LNIALGGSLYQDIPSDLPQSQFNHRESALSGNRALLAHSVTIDPASKLAVITGTTELAVNTLHHQSVKAVGQGLKVTGSAPDGVIEALESEQHRWVLSVQWHPEELYHHHEWSRKLFGAYVDEVRGRK